LNWEVEGVDAVLVSLDSGSEVPSEICKALLDFREVVDALRSGSAAAIGVGENKLPPLEVAVAYVTQVLMVQRYCLLDGIQVIPPAFVAFCRHWVNELRRRVNEQEIRPTTADLPISGKLSSAQAAELVEPWPDPEVPQPISTTQDQPFPIEPIVGRETLF